MTEFQFRDRREAGKLLGKRLSSKNIGPHAIVLALPRGGVPVAAEIAHQLHAPLDVVLVRKLGVPWQAEFAMGALAETIQLLDYQLIRDLRIPDYAVDQAIQKESRELRRRERLYRGARPAPGLQDKVVVLVDDGLATGFSMAAAVKYVRSQQPQKVIVAVPVASAEACNRLKQVADECICLETPRQFYAVGEWYNDFNQVTDAEVQQILAGFHGRSESVDPVEQLQNNY